MNKVIEIKDTQNFAYILDSPALFFSVGYKVLLGQEKNGFIKCTKVSHNGKDKLIYDISRYKSMETLMCVLRLDTTMNILINLLDSIILVKNNGFMQCENILISLDRIFVDCETYKVYLIYLPLNHEMDKVNYNLFEAELKENLFIILNTYNDQNPYIDSLCEKLNRMDFTIEDVHVAFKEFKQSGHANYDNRLRTKIFNKLFSKSADTGDSTGNKKRLFSFTKKNS